MVTRTGEREIGVVSGSLTDNPGELACIKLFHLDASKSWKEFYQSKFRCGKQ